jgi:hypothetical protein
MRIILGSAHIRGELSECHFPRTIRVGDPEDFFVRQVLACLAGGIIFVAVAKAAIFNTADCE